MQNIQSQYLNDLNEILARDNLFGKTVSVFNPPHAHKRSSSIILDEGLACTSLHIDNERLLLLEASGERYIGTIKVSPGNNLLTVFGSYRYSTSVLKGLFVDHQRFLAKARQNTQQNLEFIKKTFFRHNLGPARPFEAASMSPLVIKTMKRTFGLPVGYDFYTIVWQSVILGGELKNF